VVADEWPPIWRVTANKLNTQLWTTDSFGVGRGANNSAPGLVMKRLKLPWA